MEEEKIQKFKDLILNEHYCEDCNNLCVMGDSFPLEFVAKYIIKLEKDNKNLEEIEESHKKENGKLREKVKQLEGELEKINKQLDLDYVDKNYIQVSLVEEKIEEINKAYEDSKDENGESQYYYPDYTIRVLEELLEKRK